MSNVAGNLDIVKTLTFDVLVSLLTSAAYHQTEKQAEDGFTRRRMRCFLDNV